MKILVIEDNRQILANIIDYLSLDGHTVDCAHNGNSGLNMALVDHFDMIVLDLMLPGIDGYQVCARLRDAQVHTPIIMLTAMDALDDRIKGLKLGADDYLLKPFALPELSARIESVARRANREPLTSMQVGGLEFNLQTLQVRRDGTLLKLNPTSKRILEILMKKSPAIVKKESLEHALWGDNLPEQDILRAHMHQLRQVVDRPYPQALIHTIRGIGYSLAQADDTR